MRYLIYLVVLVVLAVALAVAAQLYLNAPVLIRYGEWSASPPLSLALGAALLAIVALLLAVRAGLLLLFLPLRIAEWRRRRRREKQMRLIENTLQQQAYGNRRELLKHLAELAPASAAAAWQAALLAEELGDARAESRHLQQAAAADADKVISAAAKAKQCLRENRLVEAHTLLKTAGAPQGSALLAELYYDISLARADYRAALAAAARLREESARLYGDRVEKAAARGLQAAADSAAMSSFWREAVSAADKKQPALLAIYIAALWRAGDEKAAGEGLTQAIKQHPHSGEILRLVIDIGAPQQREAAFKANEKRAETAGAKDAGLLELLAELADKLQLPGKARAYGQMLAALKARHNR